MKYQPQVIANLMLHTIPLNTTVNLKINAAEPFSTEKVSVNKGEEYHIYSEPNQIWNDWYIKASPDGYSNFIGAIWGLRVKGAKCFCLCGAYNEDHSRVFAIGSDKTFIIEDSGTLSFFANDVKGFYGNNRGVIAINVRRTN